MLQLTKMIQDADLTDVELITKIVQTSFFDDATPEDTRKTIWLLEHYTNMIDSAIIHGIFSWLYVIYYALGFGRY